MSAKLPRHTRVAIIGGGAVGCSIAWALTRSGIADVVLLEKNALTHGSTWHAAGLVGQFRTRADLTRLMRASVRLLDEIESDTPIGWRRVGSLRIASSPERLEELQRSEALASSYGVDFSLISVDEACQRFPYLARAGVHGAAFVEGDGYVDPTSLTNAYAARARAAGAILIEGVTVTAIAEAHGGGYRLETSTGVLTCEMLVLAPGVWATAVGRMLGMPLAVAALEHQYAVTAKLTDMPRDLPTLRDPDHNFYLKPETGAFAVGGWEPRTVAVHGSLMPFTFGRELLSDDLDRLQPILEAASRRLPILDTLGLREVINGPIPVTPDGEPIVGPAPGRSDLYLAIGFTSGIAASAGAGEAIAQWIANGRPEIALPSLDPTRFRAIESNICTVNEQAIAAYANYYALSRGSSGNWQAGTIHANVTEET